MSKTIKIFVTGGTFDKEFNMINGELFFKETHINEILKLGRCKLDFDVESLMMVDSLDMKDSERQLILSKCKETALDRILITHGTDTMEDTAKLLGKNIQNKTIIITGAMIPYNFGASDGLFNFGSALSFLQVLEHGVYIAMNGIYFQWDNVRKNKNIGMFEKIN